MFNKAFLTASMLFAAALATGCVAEQPVAADTAAPQQVVTADNTTADVKKIKNCQTDQDTGSHLRSKTVCLTEEQEREQRQAIEASRSFRQTGQGGKGGQ